MSEYLIQFIGWWTVIGYFMIIMIPQAKMPKKKSKAILLVVAAGPIAWLSIGFVGFCYLFGYYDE